MTDTLTINMPRSWAERALEELKDPTYGGGIKLIKELIAALEQPQDHPEQRLNMVPAGWKLVPVEATDSQIRAAQATWWHACNCETYWDQIYAAMLAAAPQRPAVERHADDAAVSRFAEVMKNKLAAARDKGRGGWDDPEQCTVEHLAKLLVDHVAKGDPVDVANFAMMLHQREADKGVLAAAASQPQVEQEPVAWQYRMRPDWGSKKDCWGPWQDCTKEQAAMYQRVPLLHDWAYESRQLYTHPQPKREPLTEGEILNFGPGQQDAVWSYEDQVYFARAIERAHKIGGEA